ncbi:unnamed protein product [Rotaria magnacalcarata]|uniref:Hexosyltransferase n=1 Tax=Rotaria magnacalcarata TaxID=392030 RepID=A0A818WLE4_9BILA|nr:unnamed protein product [Rotaria magnacalcarata]CAF2183505.1 unnamed protein product [Rotaria magnacalcarata]CAF3726599.1 unnamed protein product [Rotaria magnacalcarata]CAF3776306.1 unnamed protein product [Rotaria magnacalcarata]
MLLSFYIHIILLISFAIFSVVTLTFIKRIYTENNLLSSTPPASIRDTQIEFRSLANGTNKSPSNASVARNDESDLRENIFGSAKAKNSILDRLTFINPPNTVCIYPDNTENYMIIIVLSRALNFDFRQAIRATWGRNEKYKGYNTIMKTIFFVGTDDSVQLAVRLEQARFNDVIEIVIPENYAFVAHKELASLLWTRLYCPLARIVFRADDDILMDTFSLLNFIKHDLNLNVNDGLYGWFRLNNSVHRGDRWAVTRMEYKPNTYPPYTFGVGYLFSNSSCQRLLNAANQPNHQIVRIGDAYITGILRDLAGIPFYDFHDLEFSYTFHDQLPCDEYFMDNPRLLLCMSKLHLGIREDLFEFYDTWDIILSKHNTSLSDASY